MVLDHGVLLFIDTVSVLLALTSSRLPYIFLSYGIPTVTFTTVGGGKKGDFCYFVFGLIESLRYG